MDAFTPSKFRLSFQAKVLIPVVAFLILLPAITVWILDRHVETSASEEALKTLTTVRSVFRNSLNQRQRNLEVRFRNMVNEPRFKAVAQLGDGNTMQAFLDDALEVLGEEIQVMIFTPVDPSQGSSGAHRAHIQDVSDFESSVASSIQPAMAGEAQSTLAVYGKHAFNVVSVPVSLSENSSPLGVLTLGLELGQNAVNDLKSLTRTEVLLYIDNEWVAGTLERSRLTGIEDTFFKDSDLASVMVRPQLIDGEHFHILSGRFGNPDTVSNSMGYILLSSYEERLRDLRATRITLLSVSAIGIVISVTIILILVRNVTRPLRELRDGAEAVGRGDFSRRVRTDSTDECGDLAKTFNQMTSNLQTSRSQLEANVLELQNIQNQLIQREARLRESEEGLRLIIEGARDHVIFTIDDQGRILRWNGAAERMLGYHASEVTNVSYDAFFDEEDQKKGVDQKILSTAAQEGRAEFEGWRVAKDGSRFWADVTLSRIDHLPGANSGGYVEIARDITTRKKAEKALIEARNAAEASNRAKNEFMGNMSHEIRTPMNGIIGMTSLLLEEELSDEQHDLADTIRTSADSLLAIIDDILDISKIEAGQMEISTAPVNLIELLEITVQSFAHICAEKELSLNICIGPAVPPLFETDSTRVRQILSNLIGNAAKFTIKGGIRIDVNYSTEEEELVISVQDSGIGIPEDKFEKLFTPFFQVESTNSRRFGGTGLGLSISKRIARLLNGEIFMESVLNKGSTFTFKMKAVPMDEDLGLASFTGRNTLLLTNNLLSRKAIGDQIQIWGANVVTLDIPPKNLVTTLQKEVFDIVVIDDSDPSGTEASGFFEAAIESLGEEFPPYIRLIPHNQKARSPWPGNGLTLNRPVQPTELNGAFIKLLTNMSPAQPRQVEQLPARKELDADFAEKFPYRILVVEDNPINAKVLITILKRLGYSADSAFNGEECISAMQASRYDIVFMDLQMPVMDGYKATSRILSSDSINYPVFITAFTANARQDDRDACEAIGMHDFVSKPAMPKKITDVIQRAHKWLMEHSITPQDIRSK